MTYASASDAGLFCPEIIGSGQEFSDTSEPNRAQVEGFLVQGYALINTRLAGRGYNTPVLSSATVYGALTSLEALYAAANVHFARMSSRLGPQEIGKGQAFMQEFTRRLDELLKLDLSRAGVSVIGTGKLYAGGISKSDKDTREADTDRVDPRFQRDQFRMSGTALPGSNAQDEEID